MWAGDEYFSFVKSQIEIIMWQLLKDIRSDRSRPVTSEEMKNSTEGGFMTFRQESSVQRGV